MPAAPHADDLILERGRVVAHSGDDVVVESHSRAACPRCAAGRGCGGGLIAAMMGDRLHSIVAGRNGRHVAVGDTVTIGIAGRDLVKAALVVYLVPVATLIAGAVTAFSLRATDAAAAVGGLAGLAFGLGVVYAFDNRARGRAMARPVIVASDRKQ